MNIPIEDFYEDIVGKAMRGLHISESELSRRSGVPPDIIARLSRGEFCDEAALRKIAPELGLDPVSLTTSAAKAWYPRKTELDGLAIFNTPYRDMRVNAYLIWGGNSRSAAVFDTGTDVAPILAEVEKRGLHIDAIFVTHTHNDHIADLDRLRVAAPDAVLYANRQESWPGATVFDEGETFSVGGLSIETLTTSGHSVGGTTYVISGLEKPVAVVGDAMFAGSMGGGLVSFTEALENNRTKIMTLPDDIVLCPGHGPMTTVGEEKRHNPFFPELK